MGENMGWNMGLKVVEWIDKLFAASYNPHCTVEAGRAQR